MHLPLITSRFALNGCLLFALVTTCAMGATPPPSPAPSLTPTTFWSRYAEPEEAGFSAERLAAAQRYSEEIGSAAVMVVYRGAVLTHWGAIETRFMCHSVRKSFLSALYGIYTDEGTIDLDSSMAELGIEDDPPLTDQEKQATIRQLLQARSGVYHAAAYETAAMKEKRPPRGSHPPGTFYYYNNWDFNTLGTLFNQRTGTRLFEAFDRRIASPLGMQDFRVQDGYYHLERHHSMHPAYPFRMSARDMARFGLLFLREGQWDDKRILSREWVNESTRPHSIVNDGRGYGYLWWTFRDEPFHSLGTYAALGFGGHAITVVPGADLVLVHRVNTWWDLNMAGLPHAPEHKVSNNQILKLLKMILDAKTSEPKPAPRLVPLPEPAPASHQRIQTDFDQADRYIGRYAFREQDAITLTQNPEGMLILQTPRGAMFDLWPLTDGTFMIDDLNAPVSFELGDNGQAASMTLELTPGKARTGRRLADAEK